MSGSNTCVRFHLSGTNPDAGIPAVSCLPDVRSLEISLQFRGIKSFQRVLHHEIIVWSLAKNILNAQGHTGAWRMKRMDILTKGLQLHVSIVNAIFGGQIDVPALRETG
jgi:hypothetical protein